MSEVGHFQPEILKAATRLAAGLASKLTQIQPIGVSQIPAGKCQLLTHAPQQRSDHSITSSARVSSVGGTSRPSASAVLRLMNSSIFVDCWKGQLAGLSPFRTRL